MHPIKSYKFLAPVLFALLLTCASLPTQAQTYKVLHTFTGAPKDGQWPLGTLVRDAAGNLYGTTQEGGSGMCGQFSCGTVFMVNKSGNEVGVFSFNGEDGGFPFAGLLRDAAGNLYGTTMEGGTHSCQNGSYSSGCGTVFQLNKRGNKLRYYSFDGSNGEFPQSTPVELSGSFYGTTLEGGNNNFGILYKVNALGKETVLHRFTGGSDGCAPGALTADTNGNLYGVTGIGLCNGTGTLFELDTAGTFTTLYEFGGDVGYLPRSLTFDTQGNLYGTAEDGGSNGDGTVFELSPGNGTWTGRPLYAFCSLPLCADGDSPRGQLVRDANTGNIYGVTYDGDTFGNGTIFKLDPSGNETVLYSFTGGSDGGFPFGGLVMDASGNLYGTAEGGGDISCPGSGGVGCGVVFELTP
jgi:uncharacterized repeat protein (TIGR03803 family)